MQNQLAYNLTEACRVSRIGRTTLYAAIHTGELRARKVGRRTVVLHQDLVDWLDSCPGARDHMTGAAQRSLNTAGIEGNGRRS
jgi:excisionase family DNA binding protein